MKEKKLHVRFNNVFKVRSLSEYIGSDQSCKAWNYLTILAKWWTFANVWDAGTLYKSKSWDCDDFLNNSSWETGNCFKNNENEI